ncbi:uncharacterized protein LOC134251323 isoform X2 [Saccostrea cucullata]
MISRKTCVTNKVQEDMVRKREMMADVHAELMTLEKKKAENFIKNYIGNIILAANEKLLNETSREYVHRVIVLAMSKLKKEIQKSTRVSSKVVAEQIQPETDTDLEDSKPRKYKTNEDDTFVPRRLFFFNVDHFKINSQRVATVNKESLVETISVPAVHLSARTVSSPTVTEKTRASTKRPGFRARIMKFLGFQSRIVCK